MGQVVGTGEHHQIGELRILVTGGHQILPGRAGGATTADDMQSRELVSTLAPPRYPFISLLAT